MVNSPVKTASKKATPIRVQVAPKALASSDDTSNPLDSQPQKGHILGFELSKPKKCTWLFDRPKDNVACTTNGKSPPKPKTLLSSAAVLL